MQRPKSQLGHHLLTRSDLATMAVRATEVFRWLADGTIEQIGDLPQDGRAPDPVFAVNDDALRTDLVERLAGIGKSTVVMTPLGVRSFLLRTLLLGRDTNDEQGTEHAAGLVDALEAQSTEVEAFDARVAEHRMESDLAEVLHDALHEFAPDVEALLQIAAEIAAAESTWHDGPGESDAEEAPSPPENGPHEVVDEDDIDACFDFDELTELRSDAADVPPVPEGENETLEGRLEATMSRNDVPLPESREQELQVAPGSESAFEQLFATVADEADTSEQRTVDAVVHGPVAEAAWPPAEPTAFEEPVAVPSPEFSNEQAVEDVVEASVSESDLPVPGTATVDMPAHAVTDRVTDESGPEEEGAATPDVPIDDADDALERLFAGESDRPAVTSAEADTADEFGHEPLAEMAWEPAEPTAFEEPVAVPSPELVAGAEIEASAAEAVPNAASAESAQPSAAAGRPQASLEAALRQPQPMVAEGQIVNEPLTGTEDPSQEILDDQTEVDAQVCDGTAEQLLARIESAVVASEDAPTSVQTEPGTEALEDADVASEPPTGEPEFDEALVDAMSDAVEAQMAAVAEPAGEEFALSTQAMDKVQDFLGELRSALVEMAQRPQQQPPQQPNAPTIDVTPLVEAVQVGFEKSAEQATQTSTALASLAERVGQFGQQVESSVQQSVKALAAHKLSLQEAQAQTTAPIVVTDKPRFLVQRPDRQTLVLGAVAILVICWSIMFWFKTGSPRLAFGTLIGANLVGCCLLVARRD